MATTNVGEAEKATVNVDACPEESLQEKDVEMSPAAEEDAEKEDKKTTEHLLKNLHLRKIIKENHGSPLECLVFNEDPDHKHMLATTGGGLISIYDNNHCGGHLDLSCVFSNEKTEFSAGGLVTELAWLDTHALFQNEAFLAFGGNSGEIGIISVAQTRVVELLKGHQAKILDLFALSSIKGCLLSCSEDKTVRFWNALCDEDFESVLNRKSTPQALNCFTFDNAKFGNPTAIAVNKAGTLLVVGFSKGWSALFEVDFQEMFNQISDRKGGFIETVKLGTPLRSYPSRGIGSVDCIRFLSDEKFVLHTTLGKVHVHDLALAKPTVSFTMPSGEPGKGTKQASQKTHFGLSRCGTYMCCGNDAGQVFIYNLDSGQCINRLSMPRIKGFVSSSAFAFNNHSLALCTNDSLLWRWDYAIVPEVASSTRLE